MSKGLLQEKEGDWIFLTPVGNLVLTNSVNKEFKVDRVLFVDQKKLPRIRKRLGLNARVSEIKKSTAHTNFFEHANTYAVMRTKGRPVDLETECFRTIRDALSILALSQLGYSKRRFVGQLSLLGEHKVPSIEHFFLNKNDSSKLTKAQLTKNPSPLILDERWNKFQKQMFFTNLMKILSKERQVAPNWRKDLRKASILVGQSINSNDVSTSFLWNMIALELLLTKGGEKHFDILPKRAEAFLGWIGYWQTQNYEERIKEVYRKRSMLVHQGAREIVTKKDLLFTDDLLLNLFVNLVKFPTLFGSKEKIVEFAEKVEAEHKLGIKSKVQPNGLGFFSRKYTEKDLSDI